MHLTGGKRKTLVLVELAPRPVWTALMVELAPIEARSLAGKSLEVVYRECAALVLLVELRFPEWKARRAL